MGIRGIPDPQKRETWGTLPNGITASYSYDSASQLTGIVYQGIALGTQNLTYSYDLAGRRVGVSGSLPARNFPPRSLRRSIMPTIS
jgi:YD repeat-containing protein